MEGKKKKYDFSDEAQTRISDSSCCGTKNREKPKNIGQAVLYGMLPHTGCIAFIIASVLGVTVLTQFFRPLLMSRNFFYILILISLLFATLSSVLYLRKNGFLTSQGIRKKWKYLTTMYGVTIGVNLALFMIIFPLLANVSSAASSSAASSPLGGGAAGGANADLASLQLKVDIPCPGHAPLITGDLKIINGVQGVKFSFPNNFDVTYDSAKTSKQEILALEVFQEYKATVVSELASIATQQDALAANVQGSAAQTVTGGCGCGGGSGGCEGTGGGCGGSAVGSCGGSAGGCAGSATGSCGGSGGGCGGAGTGTCGARY